MFFVFDIDDLESVVSSNIREREREAERAELIRRVGDTAVSSKPCAPSISALPSGALRQKLHDIAKLELARQRSRLGDLSAEQEQAIEALLLSTVKQDLSSRTCPHATVVLPKRHRNYPGLA